MECSVINCDNKSLAKSYCGKHYARFRKYGDPLTVNLIIDGLSSHPYYYRWKSMVKRCINKNSKNYKDYGARGIKVQKSWISRKTGLKNYIDYINSLSKPSNKHNTIDRIDNNGSYEEGNLRWATMSEQLYNKRFEKNPRCTNKSGYNGIYFEEKKQKWRAIITYESKQRALGTFSCMSEAIQARIHAEIKFYGEIKTKQYLSK